MNPLQELHEYGQSVWLDYIRADLLDSGELARLVREDGVRGVTSNPSIFQKALAGDPGYETRLRTLLAEVPEATDAEIFERIAVQDIQRACDLLLGVYQESGGTDGFVSLEVSPRLARDTPGTVEEARRLWSEVNRANLLIKVPATREGIPAIETLIAEEISVNVTLMFSMDHYEAVSAAYLRGLARAERPERVASVASFFVSRVDTAVDEALEAVGSEEALALRGRIAVANAKMAYRRFRELFHGKAFQPFAQKGAHAQRPLWASTSTKNPAYRDVLYVEELIGADTVNTLPPETLAAFRDHGKPRASLSEGMDQAAADLARLEALGVDLRAVTERLQEEGVKAFSDSYDRLLATISERRKALATPGGSIGSRLGLGASADAVEARLAAWSGEKFAARLWKKDTTLWSERQVPELADRLGWLNLPETMLEAAADLEALATEVREEGLRHAVVLGMGGSSLAPEVFSRTFAASQGAPELAVLDSTHPRAVLDLAERLDTKRTLFMVSSKSGTTLETLSLFRYFWTRVAALTKTPGRHFVAITDPGTPLQSLAEARGFRRVFQANPEVGGRYSALTHFGLAPAALMGVPVRTLLESGRAMARRCADHDAARNPGLQLGAILGELAKGGRDKVTFFADEALAAFPVWIEQLIAESTGKEGKGIVPVAGEPLGKANEYGEDRLFVSLTLGGTGNEASAKLRADLRKAGHPVIELPLGSLEALGGEFFRWEVAVASAGAVLGIQPFNQPDVQLAKDLAKKAMARGGGGGAPAEEVSAKNAGSLARSLEGWLGQGHPGDYACLQAYLAPRVEVDRRLKEIAVRLRRRLGIAVTTGYGPRFLHSTGQLHKGGPNTGLFLQIVDEPAESVAVPETDFTFGALIRAQALGDLDALRQRKRRVLRVNVGRDAPAGLELLLVALAG
ncbi:MAG: bifunctional transaldolase/phosoglucose isomerase [Acidobacteriota bacterium]